MASLRITFAVPVLLLLCTSPSHAQNGANVLIVANETDAGSIEIAERYATARAIPASQILRLKMPVVEGLSRIAFEQAISRPIGNWLSSNSAQDRILYIVLTRGIPLRIAGTSGRQGTGASVDSELTLLYRRLTGAAAAPGGSVPNPYFAGNKPVDGLRPFRRADHDIYLVTRLDGFTVADGLALIDRGQTRSPGGRVLLDDVALLTDPRSKWLKAAAERLVSAGFEDRVVHETTSRPLKDEKDVIGYYSWGSNDRALATRHPGLTFAPGALAAMFQSTDARTLVEPPAAWVPGGRTRTDIHGGSNQSLVGDLVRHGVTGVAGHVAEPFLDGAIRPDILFPAYLKGSNLAEAFYQAVPHLSWQTVVIGDPLAQPFGRVDSPHAESDPPPEPTTELPKYFSSRRLANMTNPRLFGTSDQARRLFLRAESRQSRSDPAGAVQALTEAVALDPASLQAWRLLGALHEAALRHTEASDAYRRIIALDRNDVTALNNLAYHVAVREKKPDEALGLASRAALLSRGNPTVEDTLGWVHHLLGNDQEALHYVARASRALPKNAEVQFHAAAVFAALGRLGDAAKALDAAAALEPSLAAKAEFVDLRQKIKG